MDSNKKVFITGANKGIGFATTKLFAEKGYQVWMGVRNMERGAKAHQLIKEQNFDVQLLKIDISDDKSAAKAAKYIEEHI